MHIEEVDEEGEGITARTSDLELLNATATDPRLNSVELYNGLVLCFPYQSARIDPVAISLFLMGIGGVWIVVGLVVMDRL